MLENSVLTSLKAGVREIIFNRPNKRNAINKSIYVQVAQILNEDAANDKVVVTIITGKGDFYSSGNDFSVESLEGHEDPFKFVKIFIEAFINYPKLLIAVVNGPAIGIAATTAAVCDVVYCSDKAYFHTPFINLGLCAEGGSSLTYPKTLGRSNASQMLLLGEKLCPEDAFRLGFVSKVIPHAKIPEFVKTLHKYGKLPLNSVKITKQLVLANLKNVLIDCNKREIEGLQACLESEEYQSRIVQFLTKKSKL